MTDNLVQARDLISDAIDELNQLRADSERFHELRQLVLQGEFVEAQQMCRETEQQRDDDDMNARGSGYWIKCRRCNGALTIPVLDYADAHCPACKAYFARKEQSR